MFVPGAVYEPVPGIVLCGRIPAEIKLAGPPGPAELGQDQATAGIWFLIEPPGIDRTGADAAATRKGMYLVGHTKMISHQSGISVAFTVSTIVYTGHIADTWGEQFVSPSKAVAKTNYFTELQY
jgi:hypothetical protein